MAEFLADPRGLLMAPRPNRRGAGSDRPASGAADAGLFPIVGTGPRARAERLREKIERAKRDGRATGLRLIVASPRGWNDPLAVPP